MRIEGRTDGRELSRGMMFMSKVPGKGYVDVARVVYAVSAFLVSPKRERSDETDSNGEKSKEIKLQNRG